MKNLNYLSKILLLGILFYSCSGGDNSGNASEQGEQSETSESTTIKGEEVTYTTDSTTMNGYIAYNPSIEEKRPGIIVVHEWWGHNEYTRQRADMLAEMGYTAIAVDMYGDGKLAEHPEDAGKFAGQVFSNMDEAQARFTQAMETLRNHPSVDPESISAIGYCFGGSIVLTMANAGYDLDAVAAFHSGVQLPIAPDAETFKSKVLVCNGGADPMITADQADAFKATMDAIGADYKYISYEDALHAFTNPGADELGEKFQLPLAYNEAADKASWSELEQLLQSVY